MNTIFKISCFLLFALCLSNCNSNTKVEQQKVAFSVSPIMHESFNTLAPIFEKQNDTIYVINFWATWCKPCVKELPYFEQLHNTSKDKKVKVILVSLDFPNQIESKLIPFIKKEQLKSEIHVLIDGDANAWIPKIADEWSGAIPATLVYNKNKRDFYEQSFESYEELNTIIKPFIKN